MIWNSCMTRWTGSDQGTWEPLKSIAVRVHKENKWLQWVFVDIDIIIWSWFSRISIFCASILLWSWSVKYTFLYHRNKTNNLQVFFISIKIRIWSSNQIQNDVEYTHINTYTDKYSSCCVGFLLFFHLRYFMIKCWWQI